MTIIQMLEQSGVLTVLGMGIVFGFLVTMVICVTAMGKIIRALMGDKGLDTGPSGISAEASGAVRPAAVTAAITAAVTEYQKTNT